MSKGERQKPASEMSDLEVVTVRIHRQLNDPSVQRVFGAMGLHQHAGGRRIVWVRVQSPVEPPKQAGGRMQSRQGAQGEQPKPQDGSRWRLARVRVQTVDAHIYGEDDGVIDETIKNLIAAVETECPQVNYIFEDWPLDTEEMANLTRYPKAVLRMQIRLTVSDEVLPLKPALGEAHSCGILRDDGTINSS
jgi:hypothetical protein